MEKGPISFRARAKKHNKPNRPRRTHQGGELDEWFDYWRERLRHPWSLGGRTFWTERMLYGNALAGGLLVALIEIWLRGFSVLGFVSAVLNVVFLAFIWYYAVPWVTGAIHGAVSASHRPPDTAGLKTELIGVSGLFTLVPFLCLWSFPMAFWIGTALVAVVLWRSLSFYYDESLASLALETVAATALLALVTAFFFR